MDTPDNGQLSSAEPGGFPRAALNCFIVLYLLALGAVVLPVAPLRERLGFLIAPIANPVGLWQSWALFAPGIRNYQMKVYAVVTYQDGSWRLFELPSDDGRINTRVKSWKLRELFQDFASWRSDIWPDIARFVARACNDQDAKPLLVSLAVARSGLTPDSKSGVRPSARETFYVYQVLPGDLQ